MCYTSIAFRQLYKEAKDSDNWTELTSIFSTIFSSFDEINAAFKVSANCKGTSFIMLYFLKLALL